MACDRTMSHSVLQPSRLGLRFKTKSVDLGPDDAEDGHDLFQHRSGRPPETSGRDGIPAAGCHWQSITPLPVAAVGRIDPNGQRLRPLGQSARASLRPERLRAFPQREPAVTGTAAIAAGAAQLGRLVGRANVRAAPRRRRRRQSRPPCILRPRSGPVATGRFRITRPVAVVQPGLSRGRGGGISSSNSSSTADGSGKPRAPATGSSPWSKPGRRSAPIAIDIGSCVSNSRPSGVSSRTHEGASSCGRDCDQGRINRSRPTIDRLPIPAQFAALNFQTATRALWSRAAGRCDISPKAANPRRPRRRPLRSRRGAASVRASTTINRPDEVPKRRTADSAESMAGAGPEPPARWGSQQLQAPGGGGRRRNGTARCRAASGRSSRLGRVQTGQPSQLDVLVVQHQSSA